MSDREGAVASWLVRCTPDRVVRVRALVFLDKAVYFQSVPLFTQVYKWVPVTLILEVTLQ